MQGSSRSGSGAASGRNKIVLVGASGVVGKETIRALVRAGAADSLVVCSGDPGRSCAAEYCGSKCRCVSGDMSNPKSLKSHFHGEPAVFLIPPETEERVELVENALKVAKEAGVSFVLTISSVTADLNKSKFDAHFNAIEKGIKACGIPFTILRCPMFMDNVLMQAEFIREGKIQGALDGSIEHTSVAVRDLGEAAAAVLMNPSEHHGKTYTIASAPYTRDNFAKAWSRALGKRVVYEQVPDEKFEKVLLSKGVPKFQVQGLLEAHHLINEDKYNFSSADFRKLAGREPTNILQFIDLHKADIMRVEKGEELAKPAKFGPSEAAVGGVENEDEKGEVEADDHGRDDDTDMQGGDSTMKKKRKSSGQDSNAEPVKKTKGKSSRGGGGLASKRSNKANV